METPASYGTGRPRTEFREEPCKSALNRVRGMGFGWSLNPYMGCAHRCTFCYVRNFERRADRPSGEAYGTSIRVKTNVVEVLRRELGRRGWRREVVAIGAATDPYQPAEGRYRLTRGCLEALLGARTPVQLITRGPMVVRDLDVLAGFAGRAALEVNFSIPTLDVEVWRRTEPGTAPPRQRLRALERLASAGVRVGVGMAPVLPGLSDRPQQLAAVVRAAREAGASHVWANVLHLQPGTREHFLEQLGRDWPEERARYEAMYGPRGCVAASVAEPVLERVARLRERYGVGERGASFEESGEAEPRQLSLFG
ncbi:MAG: radical SAM protein [Dehalococcoidia bacterium]